MGFLDRLRMVKSWGEAAYASGPRWARITGVGRKVGPVTTIELEVHYGNAEPFEVSTLQFVPRGVTPQVGEEVAVRPSSGDNHTTYLIEWDEAPHYGDPELRLVAARQMLDAGLITQADFDRARDELDS